MIINLVKHINPSFTTSIKDKFTTDMGGDCPIVSYSIVKVMDKNSKQPVALSDCSKLFSLDSTGDFSV